MQELNIKTDEVRALATVILWGCVKQTQSPGELVDAVIARLEPFGLNLHGKDIERFHRYFDTWKRWVRDGVK